MDEQTKGVCGSCGYPQEAGHSDDCARTKKEQNHGEHSFSNLSAKLEKVGYDKTNILTVCTEENLIGHGGNADVYQIPGVETYVVRVKQWGNGGHEIQSEIEEVEDVFPEFNVGQAVAKMPEDGIFFLKRQTGIPAGVPYGEIRRKGGEKADSMYAEHSKRAAEMPQSAYDEFAKLLIVINERDHQFDPSKANNVLVDVESGSFNLVDINKREEGSTYRNSITDMIVTLIDNSYAWKYRGEIPLETYRKKIIEKCLEAGKKTGLYIPRPEETDTSLDYSFELAGQKR
ncbi:MAG: hypothetical protein HYY51_02270 [Candidatus Magasanikbacteria bacterium]|nr:hypothetical protein [Candidatus Magasanikbacteria bacterium]